MKVKNLALAALIVVLAACGRENRTGQPETDTTGNVQSEQQTADTASATTTGVTGGTSTVMSNEDKEFVAMAGMGGLAAVQMGNLALQKASSAGVKAFAQRMVSDHSKANAELAQFATAKGLALPTELADAPKAAYGHLDGLSGAAFDKAYMQHMVEDHEKDVAAFDKASTSASDTDLKAWAGKTLPTLKEHLELAKTTARGV